MVAPWLKVVLTILSMSSTASAMGLCESAFAPKEPVLSVQKPLSFEQMVVLETPESLVSVKLPSLFEFPILNRAKIDALNAYDPVVARGRKPFLSVEELSLLFAKIRDHQVLSIKALATYDPERRVSFCFGRAVAFHLEAMHMGLNKDSIRKVWALGELYHGYYADRPNAWWSYHVATVVKGSDGGWWALDTRLFDKPVRMEDWYAKVNEFARGKPFNFFVTEPKRVFPMLSSPFRGGGKEPVQPIFFSPYLLYEIPFYFSDYFESVQKEVEREMGEGNQ